MAGGERGRLSSAYTQHWYPVLGVVAENAGLTGQAILRHFGGDAAEQGVGWDPVGPARGARWQTAVFGSVDDVPRRKAWGQRGPSEGAAEGDDLSPRGGALSGEGLMTPRWVAKQQQRRPAVVVSLHALAASADSVDALGAELARNRVCLAARGLAYTAVIIVGSADPAAEADRRVAAVAQRAGLDPAQLAVYRPGPAAQLQAFVRALERGLFARAAQYYAEAFMHTQGKLAALPQLPVGARPEVPVRLAGELAAAVDPAVVARYSRFLPLRGWLARYHFKLALFAECAGDRDTAQRCLWLAYLHLLAYVGEIAGGAYLPPSAGNSEQPEAGWLWALNGAGAGDVWQRAHSLRMFGRRWDEALELLEAISLRLVRGWLYQSLDVGALRSMQGSAPRFTVAAVTRSGPRAPSMGSAGVSPATPPSAAGRAGGFAGGSLDRLIFSVHAGEMSAVTERLMDAERARRRDGSSTEDATCFVALGSETADVDVLQAPGAAAGGWWPLGGFYAAVDFGPAAAATTGLGRMRESSRVGLVVNSAQDMACTTAQLPADTLYDQCLTLAARQAAEHIRALALVLTRAGFGDSSSYFWACVERHYRDQAALYQLAAERGMGFGRALRVAMLRATAAAAESHPQLHHAAGGRHLIASLTAALSQRPPPVLRIRPASEALPLLEPPQPSTAFAGFAFGHSLAGVGAVPGWAAPDTYEPAGPDLDTGRPVELKPRGGDAVAVASAPPARAAAGAGGGGSLYPQWMWPESAAFLLQSAALGSLRRRQQLAVEERVYAADSGAGPARVFSANPGVENTYQSLWLAAERTRDPGDATSRLLAAAIASLATASAEPQTVARAAQEAMAADGTRMDALLGLISPGAARPGADHFLLCLATELAEAYAAAGRCSPALQIFERLAARFRAEGWAPLTAHALRWSAHCAGLLGDQPAQALALFELLSPQLAPSDAERAQIHAAIEALPVMGTLLDVDMAQIHAPVPCHAQWQHWALGDTAAEMPFQVALDCRALQRPLRLRELTIECSAVGHSVRVVSGETPVAARNVTVAGEEDQPVRFYSLDGTHCNALELRPGGITVVEGRVCVGDGSAQGQEAPGDAIALLAATAVVEMGGGLALRLRWPTCAPGVHADGAPADAETSAHAAENALTRMELRLLGSAGVARMCGTGRGMSGQLALTLPLPASLEERALRRAVRTTGPASSLATDRRWLDAGPSGARWVQMPAPPPVLPDVAWDEPAFSAYSRCRTLSLPRRAPALALALPSVAARAPAYFGEAFAVEIEIANLHRSRSIALVELDVWLDESGLADAAESMSDLGASSSSSSSRPDDAAAQEHAPDPAPRGLVPWLQLEEPADSATQQRPVELRGLRPVDGSSGSALQPQETRMVTVHVRFPAAALHSARQSTATRTAVVQCVARFAHAGADSGWDGEAVARVEIPAVHPLHATAAPLPAHVASPVSVLSAADGPARNMLLGSTSVPACEMSGSSGEYCFRRPIAVTLSNAGPWAVAVERAVLRPPLVDSVSGSSLPLRVQLAGSTAAAAMGAEEPAVVAAGAAVTHVFVLDVLTTDVVRVPGTVSPGTLEVLWRRAAGGGAPVLTRMWLPPLELIHKRVQVEAEFSTPVACVGQPLAVCYRVLNPTRRVHSIEAAMHASDSFAYAGTRRTVLNLLPGHVGLLRFNMVPLAAAAPPAADASGDPQYVPGHQLLGLAPAATPAGSQPPTSPAKHSPEVSGTAAEEAEQELPPSNVAGHGWIRLPWLDIRIAQRTARSRSPESARPSQSPPATGLRGLLGAAASAAATTDSLAAPLPPPPTREMSALALGPAAAAQRRTIAALAGLAPGDADGLLTPGLDASDMLPDYFACGVHLAGAESDLEASDDEGADHPPSARLSAPRYEPAEPAETPVLRYDQTAIYCMPMPADC